MEEQSITGFVHNLSPVRNGPNKKYFDFTLQTDAEKSVCAVCFSPQKRKVFEDSAKQSCPIKTKKFIVDKKEGSSDLLMSDLVGLELLTPEAVDFEKKDLVPSNLNLSMLSSISPQQLISVKAKLIGLQDPQIVTTPKFSLNKAEGILVDEHGTVKITFWGDDIEKVESGKTYYFTSLRLKNNKINGELYVNPAKGNSNITEADPFEKNIKHSRGNSC